jgi:hypothetical protein
MDLEDGEHSIAEVVAVASDDVVDTGEEGVVHNSELLHQFRVATELLFEERLLLWSESELTMPIDPVEVLENRTRVVNSFILGVKASDGGTLREGGRGRSASVQDEDDGGNHLEIIRLVDIAMRRKKVVHDDKVDLLSPGELDTMKTVETGKQGMGVLLDVLVILLEDAPEKLVLRVANRLDDEPVVSREVEERARLARRAELREDVLGGERDEIVRGVEVEVFS